MPIDIPIIFDANVDLGYEDNVFDVLVGSIDDYVSLRCFRGYDPSIDLYCVRLEDLPRKIISTTFFNPSYDYSKAFDEVQRILVVLV